MSNILLKFYRSSSFLPSGAIKLTTEYSMLQIHTLKTLDQSPMLRDQMFMDRKHQFIDRLNWSVTSDADGREIDEYDNDQALYILVRDHDGKHRGSLRLSAIHHNFMIRDHFHNNFPDLSGLSEDTWEVTRLCICPNLSAPERRDVSQQIFRGLSHFALNEQVTEFIGLCYAPLVRIYKGAGCKPDSLIRGQIDTSLLMARWDVYASKLEQLYSPSCPQSTTGAIQQIAA